MQQKEEADVKNSTENTGGFFSFLGIWKSPETPSGPASTAGATDEYLDTEMYNYINDLNIDPRDIDLETIVESKAEYSSQNLSNYQTPHQDDRNSGGSVVAFKNMLNHSAQNSISHHKPFSVGVSSHQSVSGQDPSDQITQTSSNRKNFNLKYFFK